MAVYIVTYDLNRETVRPNITGAIYKYENWAKLSESSYAIITSETSTQVYNKLKPLTDDNDALFVITLSSPWMGAGPKDVVEWLEAALD